MDIQIDKDELLRIQKEQKAHRADESLLKSDFIEFDEEPDNVPATTLNTPTLPKETTAPKAKKVSKVNSVLRFDVPWMHGQRKTLYSNNPTERLHQEIVDFASYVSPTEEERFARTEAIDRLTSVVKSIWPSATVQIFGSFDSQLYLPSSDLDLVIVCEEIQLDSLTKPPLNKLAKAIIKAEIPLPDSVKLISKARVPIIKYVDMRTDFEVDVCFNVISGVEAAQFMQNQMKSHPAIRPLTLVLKHFLQMRMLNEVFHGGLGSYSIMCLVISFLQRHPLVQTGLIRAHENLGVLLLELFELYGMNFNSEVTGISVANGGYYFLKEDREWVQESKPHLLSIEDPQNEENDISKGSFAYGAVRQSFEHAFLILKCAFSEFESHLRKQQDSHHRSKHVPSILGSIITLDHKLLRHRYFIQQTTNL